MLSHKRVGDSARRIEDAVEHQTRCVEIGKVEDAEATGMGANALEPAHVAMRVDVVLARKAIGA